MTDIPLPEVMGYNHNNHPALAVCTSVYCSEYLCFRVCMHDLLTAPYMQYTIVVSNKINTSCIPLSPALLIPNIITLITGGINTTKPTHHFAFLCLFIVVYS